MCQCGPTPALRPVLHSAPFGQRQRPRTGDCALLCLSVGISAEIPSSSIDRGVAILSHASIEPGDIADCFGGWWRVRSETGAAFLHARFPFPSLERPDFLCESIAAGTSPKCCSALAST